MITLFSTPTSFWRVYKDERARHRALTQLVKRGKYNYFVCYKDTVGFAINAAIVTWLAPGSVYIDG